MELKLDTHLLESVGRIAARAGEAALAARAAGLEIAKKPDGTPITNADRTAHSLIHQELDTLLPNTPIISEENIRFPALAERSAWQRCWMVDPIDGTMEFMRGSPEFTVNIALLQAHRPVLAVIRAPEHDIDYLAIGGQGCWRRGAGSSRMEPICTRSSNLKQLCIVSGWRRRNKRLDTLVETLGVRVRRERLGSSLKACRVAEGAADLYVQFSHTSEWDSAAAQCIVEEAGGLLTDTTLRPLRYNTRPTLDNPEFVALADPNFPWKDYLGRACGGGDGDGS